MWILISAVITASLLGSMHCVGMCGPLAIWASGIGQRYSHGQFVSASALYHFGRLLTYALVGWLAGLAGQLADYGGEAFGLQLAAAKIVGTLMILIGMRQLLGLLGLNGHWTSRTSQSSIITAWLVQLRPHVISLPLTVRAFVTGLLTAFLPCGWLYLFALAAAGTGSVIMGPVVMVAFWVGTVPALIGLVAATRLLTSRFRMCLPSLAAVLLIVGGYYTAVGRGFADLHSLGDIRATISSNRAKFTVDDAIQQQDLQSICAALAGDLDQIAKTPLPCCIDERK